MELIITYIAIAYFATGSLLTFLVMKVWSYSHGDREYWLGHEHGLRQGQTERHWTR